MQICLRGHLWSNIEGFVKCFGFIWKIWFSGLFTREPGYMSKPQKQAVNMNVSETHIVFIYSLPQHINDITHWNSQKLWCRYALLVIAAPLSTLKTESYCTTSVPQCVLCHKMYLCTDRWTDGQTDGHTDKKMNRPSDSLTAD